MDAQTWNERYAARELVWGAEPNQFLPPNVEGLTPGRALDLACGEGRNAVWLATVGWQATAVDFSEVAIDKGRRLAARAGVDVEFVVADATTYPVEDAAFDLVIVFYLQLPAPEMNAVLDVAARALAPGGTFLLVAHDLANIEWGYGGPQDPSVLPTGPSIAEQLSRSESGARLVVDEAGELERAVQTDDGPRVAVDCIVRARRLP